MICMQHSCSRNLCFTFQFHGYRLMLVSFLVARNIIPKLSLLQLKLEAGEVQGCCHACLTKCSIKSCRTWFLRPMWAPLIPHFFLSNDHVAVGFRCSLLSGANKLDRVRSSTEDALYDDRNTTCKVSIKTKLLCAGMYLSLGYAQGVISYRLKAIGYIFASHACRGLGGSYCNYVSWFERL